MRVRIHTLWRVPVYCLISSWVSWYVTIYLGGFFYIDKTVGVDGSTQVSADPLRSLIFHGVLFAILLLLGGLWLRRSMTKKEIAGSAAIASAFYLTIVLAQLYLPNFPSGLSVKLAVIQNWNSWLSSLLLQLTGNFDLSVILPEFSPFLFVLFGKKSPDA